MRTTYLLLLIVGLLLPGYFLAQFLLAHGLDLGLLLGQLFASPISTFFVADLAVASVVFWVFVFREAQRRQIRVPWVYVVVNLLMGLSVALPLFLYVRHGARRRQ